MHMYIYIYTHTHIFKPGYFVQFGAFKLCLLEFYSYFELPVHLYQYFLCVSKRDFIFCHLATPIAHSPLELKFLAHFLSPDS